MAAQAAAQTGIAPGILKQMRPIVASLMMGALARQGAGAGAAPISRTNGPINELSTEGSDLDPLTSVASMYSTCVSVDRQW